MATVASLLLVSHLRFGGHVDADDQAEKTDSRAEDLHDEDLDEQRSVGGIRESSSRTHDSDSNTTEKVNQADGQTGSKDEVAGEPVGVLDGRIVQGSFHLELFQLAGENNGCDQTVDGDSFAENDRNQVLGLDAGSLNTATNDAGASCVNSKGGAHHGQRDGESDAETRPHVRIGGGQEPANTHTLALARHHKVQGQDGGHWEEEPQERLGHHGAYLGRHVAAFSRLSGVENVFYWPNPSVFHLTLTELQA